MDFDRFADDHETFGAPALGVTLQGGTPLSRKFVQRYLKAHTERADASSQAGLTRQVERMMGEMESP